MISLSLPWAVLVGDNHRLSPRKHGQGLFQTSKYRIAKAEARRLIVRQYHGPLLDGPVELVAVFRMPDNVRRDVTNFAKILGDSLTGIVIADDRWQVLRKTTWEVAGIDRQYPGVRLFVMEMEAA